jgi:hypothetical protein
MHWYRVFSVVAVAGRLAAFEDPASANPGNAASGREDAPVVAVARPPVLRGDEPRESVMVRLPGATVKPAAPARPAAPAAPTPVSPKPQTPDAALVAPPIPVPTPRLQATALIPVPTVAVVRDLSPAPPKKVIPKGIPKPVLPAELERDSALFCQRRISEWSQPDAYNLFGDPLRDRPAFDDERKPNGTIYAYADPTGRYRELELDFDGETGVLRSVFVYPWKMSWQDCRRLWGAKVTSADATKGRTFYSYLNRRLDVLVDSGGRVISLGLY